MAIQKVEPPTFTMSGAADESELRRLMHELQIYQTELEMQIDELQQELSDRKKHDGESPHEQGSFDEAGQIIAAHIVEQGGSVRTQIEEQLRRTERMFTSVFRASPDAMAINRLSDGLYIDINESFGAITGYLPEEVIGNSSLELQIWNNALDRQQFIEQLIESKTVTNFESRFRMKDGTEVTGLMSACIFTFANEQYILSVTRDISRRKQVEIAHQQSEARFRTIFNSASDAIYISDSNGAFLDVNDAATHLLGYSRDEFLTMNVSDIDSAEFIDRFPVKQKEILEKGELVFDSVHLTRNGQRIPVEMSCRKILYNDTSAIMGIARDITDRLNTEYQLNDLNTRLRDLNAHLQVVQEQERISISRDIHDELGQDLSVLKLDLELMELKLPDCAGVLQPYIGKMKTGIDQMVSKIQRIAAELRPPLLDTAGVTAAIEYHIEEIRKRSTLDISLMIGVSVEPLDVKTSTVVMRIIQEGLTNVIRHSHATRVIIDVTRHGSTLVLKIADNGRGILPEQLGSSHAYGLIGMRERAISCQGTFDVTGIPGTGTTLLLTIPLVPEENTQ